MKNKLYIFTLINAFYYILLSICFHKTKGLLFIWAIQQNKTKIFKYVTELYSSGTSDNLLIGLSSFFYVLLVLILLYKKKVTKLSVTILGIAIFIQLFSFMLIDSGSILETIIYDRNYILLCWIINYSFSIYLFFKNIFKEQTS